MSAAPTTQGKPSLASTFQECTGEKESVFILLLSDELLDAIVKSFVTGNMCVHET